MRSHVPTGYPISRPLTRCLPFARGETAEGLDLLAPIVVEGVLVVIRRPARDQFPAVVEVQGREARQGERPLLLTCFLSALWLGWPMLREADLWTRWQRGR